MVFCETYIWADTKYKDLGPTNTNFRHFANKIFDADKSEEPWYGIEQEYIILQNQNEFATDPYGWPSNGYPSSQGPYFCAVGGKSCSGLEVSTAIWWGETCSCTLITVFLVFIPNLYSSSKLS